MLEGASPRIPTGWVAAAGGAERRRALARGGEEAAAQHEASSGQPPVAALQLTQLLLDHHVRTSLPDANTRSLHAAQGYRVLDDLDCVGGVAEKSNMAESSSSVSAPPQPSDIQKGGKVAHSLVRPKALLQLLASRSARRVAARLGHDDVGRA